MNNQYYFKLEFSVGLYRIIVVKALRLQKTLYDVVSDCTASNFLFIQRSLFVLAEQIDALKSSKFLTGSNVHCSCSGTYLIVSLFFSKQRNVVYF